MTPTLRSRQAALARQAIMETVVRHLENGTADDLAMDGLAKEAGVSRRTLYRYFPTRAHLLNATSEWIRDELLKLPIEIGAEGIAGSFRAAATRLRAHPQLARALLHTSAGQSVRKEYRDARVKSIRAAIRAEAPGASRRELEHATAVLTYLCSSQAWISIQDEAGMDAATAQASVAWAIETILARIRAD